MKRKKQVDESSFTSALNFTVAFYNYSTCRNVSFKRQNNQCIQLQIKQWWNHTTVYYSVIAVPTCSIVHDIFLNCCLQHRFFLIHAEYFYFDALFILLYTWSLTIFPLCASCNLKRFEFQLAFGLQVGCVVCMQA